MRRGLLLSALGLSGCLNFDSLAFNPVHCSNVGPETCEEKDEWDRICRTCEEPLDWDREYPWFEQTFDAGESIRVPAVVEPLSIETDDGAATLDAYFLPSHGEDPALAQTTVLYHHGNYAAIEHYMPRVRMLHEVGYNVLIWDYRGYGKSEPADVTTVEQIIADAHQVRLFAETVAPDPARIVVYGYSLGSVPAIEAVLGKPGCALVLEAPLTAPGLISEDNALVSLPDSFLSGGHLNNPEKIRDYAGPLFAFVGSDDTRFPPRHVAKIVDNAPGPKELWVLEGVRHGISDVGVPDADWSEWRDRMRAFLEANAPECLGPG